MANDPLASGAGNPPQTGNPPLAPGPLQGPIFKAGGSGASPGNPTVQAWHHLWVTLVFETAGVLVLTIIADASSELGNIIVIMLVGWFILFLATHGGEIPGLSGSFNTTQANLKKGGVLP